MDHPSLFSNNSQFLFPSFFLGLYIISNISMCLFCLLCIAIYFSSLCLFMLVGHQSSMYSYRHIITFICFLNLPSDFLILIIIMFPSSRSTISVQLYFIIPHRFYCLGFTFFIIKAIIFWLLISKWKYLVLWKYASVFGVCSFSSMLPWRPDCSIWSACVKRVFIK